MAASFPGAKKTFTAIVNGVTKLVALLWNTAYDEIEAIQTFIGASGNSQAKNAALTEIGRNLTNPLPKISWVDADTISIEAKTVVMFDGSDYVIKKNSAAIEVVLSTDLDAGSEASSTRYYIWVTGDGLNTLYGGSISLSSTTLVGFDYAVCIGQVFNDSSGDIEEHSLEPFPIYEKLGAWETKSDDTVYQASCDGFVIALSTAGTSADIVGYTDDSNPPTTIRGGGGHYEGTQTVVSSFNMPVRKGDYWKVTGTAAGAVYWIAKDIL